MTIVKELNELAEKMTGVNPRATTDAQAMDFIEQHYQGEQPSPTPQSKFDYIIPGPIYEDLNYDITDEDTIAVLEEISNNYLDGDGNVKPLLIGVNLGNDDQGVYGFGIVSTITKYHNGLNLGVYSYVDSRFLIYIYYNGTKWKVSSNSI